LNPPSVLIESLLFFRKSKTISGHSMKTVLLIEDEAPARVFLSQFLKSLGWLVVEAEDGEIGLLLARQHRPELIICDLLMPRCNGFQVCRSIRQQTELAHTRIVLTTGRGYAADRMNALEAGANEYVVKPINVQHLSRIIRELVPDTAPAELAPDRPLNEGSDQAAKVRFWGVRGSIPTPGTATVFYGGNTSCIEVRADGEIIILDAGTGIRPLGLALTDEFKDRPMKLTLLISHTHWDHIQGFPFFLPAYDSKNQLRIMGFEGSREGLKGTLSSQMESPFFPIGLGQMPGHIVIEELRDLQFTIGKIVVQAIFVNHPGICVGYRLNTSRGSIAYLPDNEPFLRLRSAPESGAVDRSESLEFARKRDDELIAFIRDVDVLIIDAQYDVEEYKTHVGWGHGCTDDAVALALQAKAKKLFLFHHDPNHEDAKISQMVLHAQQLTEQAGGSLSVDAAREGVEFLIGVAKKEKTTA
jgi:phosphoribosyl 1,2-cyclic phosphodiesterase/ActR/RegA family two-component response regulator